MIPGFRASLGSTEETLCVGEERGENGMARERERGGYIKSVTLKIFL